MQEGPSETTSNYSEKSLDNPTLSQGSIQVSTSDPISDSSSSSSPRHSDRSNKGTHQSVRCINEVFLSLVTNRPHSSTVANVVYQAELESDFYSGEVCFTYHRDFAAKFKTYDEDNPSYSISMTGEFSVGYQRAMIKDICQLIKQNNWRSIPRSLIPKGKVVLPGTWEFKSKRLPDVTKSKFKSRYCVRGDKQI